MVPQPTSNDDSKQASNDVRRKRREQQEWDEREAGAVSAYTKTVTRTIHKDIINLGCFSAFIFPCKPESEF